MKINYVYAGALAGLLALGAPVLLASCGESPPYPLTQSEQSTAELGARDYAERMGGSYVSCSGQDSNNDGYVTCAIKLPEGEKDLVCSFRGSARGCKTKTLSP